MCAIQITTTLLCKIINVRSSIGFILRSSRIQWLRLILLSKCHVIESFTDKDKYGGRQTATNTVKCTS